MKTFFSFQNPLPMYSLDVDCVVVTASRETVLKKETFNILTINNCNPLVRESSITFDISKYMQQCCCCALSTG